MNTREIKAAIRLTGTGGDYQVHHDVPGEAIVCHVPRADIGHAIVRALRDRAGIAPAESSRASLTSRDRALIVAALAYWIREGMASSGVERDIATNGGEFPEPDRAYVDRLAEHVGLGMGF